MSSAETAGEKTEEPTPRRLRDARKRGQVAKSAELASAMSMLCVLAILAAFSSWASGRIGVVFLAVERSIPYLTKQTALALLVESMTLVVQLSAVPLALGAVVALVATALQTGPIFAFESIAPKFERLNPVAGIKRVFSLRTLVQFALMCAKVGIIGVTSVLIAWIVMPDAIEVIHAGVGAALAIVKRALMLATLWCGGLFVALGFADLLYQRYEWLKELRMSRYEVQREYREDEGDPLIRRMRKSMANEPLPSELMQYVKSASLVIAEPGGRAIALLERPDIGPAPFVILRGDGGVAREIVERSLQAGVRIVIDPVLLDRVYGSAIPGGQLNRDASDVVRPHLGATP
jgi:flagellar biosynthesis protein FlhB